MSKDVKINEYGGVYARGTVYNQEKKFQTVLTYYEMRETGVEVTHRTLAAQARVGKTYAGVIIDEIQSGSISFGVFENEKNNNNRMKGYGSKSLTPEDELVLLSVYYKNPKSLLSHYQTELLHTRGIFVSVSTISRWLRQRFPHKMSLCKTSHIPIDKFKPENALRIHEYLLTISLLLSQIFCVKFGDEKPLKGSELFSGRARRDPLTGEVPGTIVDSDFRNTYNIIGFCGVDMTTYPIDYYITDTTQQPTTAAVFMDAITLSLGKGFLKEGDYLILDNATIHIYRESRGLTDLLKRCGVTLIALPTRVPDLNPIELIWNSLVQRLKALSLISAGGRDRVVRETEIILNAITHKEVAKYYAKCGYMRSD